MGIITNGILGGVSGKVGGVVGSNWKGIDTLRAYTVPANPNSTAQQTQRTLFAAVLSFCRLILTTVLQPYWDPFATGQSGYNAAMSSNLLAWTSATDYANAIVSEGNLELDVMTVNQYVTATGAVSIEWAEAGLGNGLGTDIAICVAVDVGNNIAFVQDSTDTRADEGLIFNIGSGRTVGDVKFFLFFKRGSGDTLEVSNSDYAQATT